MPYLFFDRTYREEAIEYNKSIGFEVVRNRAVRDVYHHKVWDPLFMANAGQAENMGKSKRVLSSPPGEPGAGH